MRSPRTRVEQSENQLAKQRLTELLSARVAEILIDGLSELGEFSELSE